MQLTRFTGVAAAVLLAAPVLIQPESVAAQSAKPSALEGKWKGDAITDAFQGVLELAISRSGNDWTVTLSMTVRDKTSSGPTKVETVKLGLAVGDSIRFQSNVGGAPTTYAAVAKGDSLTGSMEARMDGELLGRGRFNLVRIGTSAPPSSSPQTSFVPLKVFDEAWTLVDTRYGNFSAKGIDWALVRNIYRDQAAAATTDREFATVLNSMLAHLNDRHVSFKAGDTTYQPDGPTDRSAFVADSIIAKRFVGPSRTVSDGRWLYAWIQDSVGYLKIDGFQNTRQTRALIDTVLTTFRNSRGIVIDLRKHFGGDDRAAKEVIDRLATTKQLYLVSRARAGARHDQYLEPLEWFFEPKGDWQFLKPVVVMTTRRTVSAGENFLLGMRELPQVTVIGDVTAGAFADVGHFTLSNGWVLNFPFNAFVDGRGRSWEGLGVTPDMRIVPTALDISSGRDVVLDLAVRVIRASSSPHA